MDPQPVQRYHALDALRAAMMLLGLVLHSAASYTQTPLREAWPYQDPRTNVAFDLLLFFIHLFRMPVFFVVAGFFAALLYYRDGAAGFARNRARRVLLPLALFWPLMIPLVGLGFVFSVAKVGGSTPFDLVTNRPLAEQPILGHLWFLYYLVLLYLVTLAVVPVAARLPASAWQKADAFAGTLVTKWRGLVILMAMTTLTLMPMRSGGLDLAASIVPSLRVLTAYGVFFAFGWFVYRRRELVATFGMRWKTPLVAGIVASVAYLLVVVAQPFSDPKLWHLAAVALASISTWLLIFGITGLFVRHMTQQRPIVRYFADASYWMYLVHLAPAAWLPGIFAHTNAPAAVKFALVLGLTTAIATVTYHYLVRSTVIGELLSGRRYPRAVWVAPRAAGV